MPGSELFGIEERQAVQEVMETGVLFRYNHDAQRKGIWKSREFEAEIAKLNNVKYAHACSSGSTAVAIAMAACGIGVGDEVIVPPFTYVATVEGALLGGALPVFAEIDETLCLSPASIRKAISPKTKAVVVVHMCGSMAKIDEIVEICKEHNLVLIEDTAQAFGGTYKGKALGTFGSMGCFSFDFFKIITCGEGGAVITNDEKLYNLAEQFSDHGHDHIGNNRGMENHPIVGFNYRIGELNAAIGLAQVKKMDYIMSQQRKHKQILTAVLEKFSEVQLRNIPDKEGDVATFLDFFLPNEAEARKVLAAFEKEGVNQLVGYKYWYDNQYHYIRNWEHVKELKTPMKLAAHVLGTPQDYKTLELPQSNALISRLISFEIKIKWTDADLQELSRRLEAALSSVFVKELA
jgi:8-amino-3,8-dideoxy-alpha-D-manno-octulosonate transaminase